MVFDKLRRGGNAAPEFDDTFLDQPLDADNSLFLHSLEEITPQELAPNAAVKKRTLSDVLYDGLRFLLMLVCAAVFVGCLFVLVRNLRQQNESADFYASLSAGLFGDEASLPGEGVSRMLRPQSEKALPVYADALLADSNANDASSVTVTKTYNMEFERMKAWLTDLAAENPDVFGYIRIPGTQIAYPIVQTTDNEHYLGYQTNGRPSVSGSIFADYRCNRTLMEDNNLILYGHNMTNGTMFNHVTKFFNEDVFFGTTITIYTFDGIYTYEPFAIFRTNASYPYFTTYFPDAQSMVDFCTRMQGNSTFNRGLTFTGEEKLLTLSTCTNVGDGRYALHARLIHAEVCE